MKLTKEQKDAAYEAFAKWREDQHFVDGNYPTEEMIYYAAVEWMRGENAKLCHIIEKYAEHESWCDWEITKTAGKNADPCDCGLDELKREAGVQRKDTKT